MTINNPDSLRAEIRGVISVRKSLTPFGLGFGVGGVRLGHTREERAELIAAFQKDMENDIYVSQYKRAKEYLAQQKRRASINRAWPVERLRKNASLWHGGYTIEAGMFIAAAIHLGFEVKSISRGRAVCLNIASPV